MVQYRTNLSRKGHGVRPSRLQSLHVRRTRLSAPHKKASLRKPLLRRPITGKLGQSCIVGDVVQCEMWLQETGGCPAACISEFIRVEDALCSH